MDEYAVFFVRDDGEKIFKKFFICLQLGNIDPK